MPDTAPPADGSTLTSSYLQTMLREQVVRTVTSSTRPSAIEGMTFYETDTDRLYLYDGTGYIILDEPTQSWTPTFSNTTTGNGTKTGTSRRSGGWVDFTALFTLGSTSAVSGAITFTLPYAAALVINGTFNVSAVDIGTNSYPGTNDTTTAGGSTCLIYVTLASGTYASVAQFSSTVPFTFGSGDKIAVSGRYQMNTRYL